MKTTIEIRDSLLRDAKEAARREGTTLRALVEEGLGHVVKGRAGRRKKYKFRMTTFKGNGLAPGLREEDWARIRELSYEGRGS